jgi:hypothetical protein
LISFDATDLAYWQALDKLCASLGLGTTYDLQGRVFRLAPLGKDALDFGATAGPVAVKIDSATLTKRFRANPTPMMGSRSGLSLAFALFVEDRLTPIETSAEVTKLVGADGKEVALEPPAAAGDAVARPRRGRGGPMRLTRGGGFFTADAPNPPASLDKLASVEGVVRLTFATGTREFRVADALNGENKTAKNGDTVITVTRAERMGARDGRGGGRGGALVVSLTYEVGGKERNLPDVGRDSAYGVTLIDPNGEKHPGNLSVGFFGGRGGPGNNPDNPRGADAQPATPAFFQNVPEIDGAWTLVVTLPEQTVDREFLFKLADVPLR